MPISSLNKDLRLLNPIRRPLAPPGGITSRSSSPILRRGLLGTAAGLIAGPLVGPRENPAYDPNDPTETDLPYKKAGFLRRLIGDPANEMNQQFASGQQEQAYKEQTAATEHQRALQLQELANAQAVELARGRQATDINLAQAQMGHAGRLADISAQNQFARERYGAESDTYNRRMAEIAAERMATRSRMEPIFAQYGEPYSEDPIIQQQILARYAEDQGTLRAAQQRLLSGQARGAEADATATEQLTPARVQELTARAQALRDEANLAKQMAPDRARLLQAQADAIVQAVDEARKGQPARLNALEETLEGMIDQNKFNRQLRPLLLSNQALGNTNQALGNEAQSIANQQNVARFPLATNILGAQLDGIRAQNVGQSNQNRLTDYQAGNAANEFDLRRRLAEENIRKSQEVNVGPGQYFSSSPTSQFGIYSQAPTRGQGPVIMTLPNGKQYTTMGDTSTPGSVRRVPSPIVQIPAADFQGLGSRYMEAPDPNEPVTAPLADPETYSQKYLRKVQNDQDKFGTWR